MNKECLGPSLTCAVYGNGSDDKHFDVEPKYLTSTTGRYDSTKDFGPGHSPFINASTAAANASGFSSAG